MRTIKTLLCLASTLLCFSVHAQKPLFSHSAGVGIYAGNSDYVAGGLLYSPRINFAVLSERATFSIGTHLGLGGNLSYAGDGYQRSTSLTFFTDMPLVVEYNFGNAATRVANTKFGGFIGGGYGWHFVKREESIHTDVFEGTVERDLNIYGPVINGGFRFPIGRASFGVRFSYMFRTAGDAISYDYGNNGLDGIGSVAFVFNIGTWIHNK